MRSFFIFKHKSMILIKHQINNYYNLKVNIDYKLIIFYK